MRIKVSLSAPFNPSKVLLPVPQDIKTISQLKKHVRQSLSTISACSTGWRELKLEVDGFELLGGSQLDVLEDGDVVTVALYPGSSKSEAATVPSGKPWTVAKRKASEPANGASKKRRRSKDTAVQDSGTTSAATRSQHVISPPAKSLPPSAHQPSATTRNPRDSRPAVDNGPKRMRKQSTSSVSSSSSSSASDSSESSDSSSSGSSASSSSSSSSSSSAASSSSSSTGSFVTPPIATKAAVRDARSGVSLPVVQQKSQATAHVPPGHGKPQTHDRNLRRRQARQHRLAALRAAEGTAASSADPVTLKVIEPAAVTPRAVSAVPSIPASLSSFVNGSTSSTTRAHPADRSLPTSSANTETRQDIDVPAAVLNRNKKKGFLKDMASLQRVRTTFGPNESIVIDPDTSMDTSMPILDPRDAEKGAAVDSSSFLGALDGGFEPNGTSTPNGETSGRRRPRGGRRSTGGFRGNRVVPPSERDVPSNVFVTSQVFSAPRWDSGKRHSAEHVDSLESPAEDSGVVELHKPVEGASTAARVAETRPQVYHLNGTGNGYAQRVVPYPEDETRYEEAIGDTPYEPSPKELAWTKIEVAFDALDYLTLDSMASCSVGSTLGWKDVALNMETFTPEVALHLGRIVTVEPEVKVRQLKRPISVWSDADGGWTLEGDDDEEPVELIITRGDLQVDAERWRVVPNIMALALGLP